MDKRGVEERQILYVAYLVLCFLVIVVLFGKVRAETRGETYHQLYYSRDIAYALNLFDRGNLTVYYPLKHDFNFVVAEGKVGVRKEETIIYPFSQGNYNIEAKKDADKLVLRKK